MDQSGGLTKTSKELVRIALDANITLQTALTAKAQRLEADLKEVDRLLEAQEVEDEPESEVAIPGSKRAVGSFPSSEFLNPLSPFYDEANRRNTYIMNTHPRPMKEKDLEVLADAVKKENERLRALRRSHIFSGAEIEADASLDSNNLDVLDWDRIAERVSDASSVKRSATECHVSWVANRPCVNRAPWTPSELQHLHLLISKYPPGKIKWVEVAEKLGTNRIPIDCMRREIYPQRHYWTPNGDQLLTKAVEAYGIDNWHLVARKVDEHVTPAQCQARWCKTLNPSLRRGAWTEEEDTRLRKAVSGYGTSWVQVATAIPGRTNDQCRERWTEYLNVGPQQCWTDEEDKVLLGAVADFGARWKEISLRVGNKKTGQACRRRYDKLKNAPRKQGSSPPTLSASGSMSFTAQTSTVLISQESASIPLPPAKADGGSAQSSVVPVARPIPKPQPHPRPRQKGTAAEHSSAVEKGVTAGAHESAIATPGSTSSAQPEGRMRAVSQLSQPNSRKMASQNIEIAAETNHTNASIGLDQNLLGPSADSLSVSMAGTLTRASKRKVVGKPEAAGSSKKMRRTQSQKLLLTTGGSPIQTGVDESATGLDDTKANTEVVKPRRGRSAAKVC